MATTNIVHAKLANGTKVNEEDIKVGLEIVYPSGLGGVLDYRCESVDAEKAVFRSLNKDWPLCLSMEFNKPDLTPQEFIALALAVNVIDSYTSTATQEQRQLAHRAHELGYVNLRSTTQVRWTDEGIELYREALDSLNIDKLEIKARPWTIFSPENVSANVSFHNGLQLSVIPDNNDDFEIAIYDQNNNLSPQYFDECDNVPDVKRGCDTAEVLRYIEKVGTVDLIQAEHSTSLTLSDLDVGEIDQPSQGATQNRQM